AAVARLVTSISERRLDQILLNALGTDRRRLERFLMSVGDEGGALRAAVCRGHGVREDETVSGVENEFFGIIERERARIRAVVEWLSGGTSTTRERAEPLSRALDDPPSDAFLAFREALFIKDGSKPRDQIATKALIRANPALADFLSSIVKEF